MCYDAELRAGRYRISNLDSLRGANLGTLAISMVETLGLPARSFVFILGPCGLLTRCRYARTPISRTYSSLFLPCSSYFSVPISCSPHLFISPAKRLSQPHEARISPTCSVLHHTHYPPGRHYDKCGYGCIKSNKCVMCTPSWKIFWPILYAHEN